MTQYRPVTGRKTARRKDGRAWYMPPRAKFKNKTNLFDIITAQLSDVANDAHNSQCMQF